MKKKGWERMVMDLFMLLQFCLVVILSVFSHEVEAESLTSKNIKPLHLFVTVTDVGARGGASNFERLFREHLVCRHQVMLLEEDADNDNLPQLFLSAERNIEGNPSEECSVSFRIGKLTIKRAGQEQFYFTGKKVNEIALLEIADDSVAAMAIHLLEKDQGFIEALEALPVQGQIDGDEKGQDQRPFEPLPPQWMISQDNGQSGLSEKKLTELLQFISRTQAPNYQFGSCLKTDGHCITEKAVLITVPVITGQTLGPREYKIFVEHEGKQFFLCSDIMVGVKPFPDMDSFYRSTGKIFNDKKDILRIRALNYLPDESTVIITPCDADAIITIHKMRHGKKEKGQGRQMGTIFLVPEVSSEDGVAHGI